MHHDSNFGSAARYLGEAGTNMDVSFFLVEHLTLLPDHGQRPYLVIEGSIISLVDSKVFQLHMNWYKIEKRENRTCKCAFSVDA